LHNSRFLLDRVSHSHYQQNIVVSTATITYVLVIQYKQRTHKTQQLLTHKYLHQFSII